MTTEPAWERLHVQVTSGPQQRKGRCAVCGESFKSGQKYRVKNHTENLFCDELNPESLTAEWPA